MNNSPIITAEEWDRIRRYIADGPKHVHLDTNEDGTMVVFNGGFMHPRTYLQIMEEDDMGEDILKTIPSASSPESPIGIVPGSLRGASVAPWKPRKDEGV